MLAIALAGWTGYIIHVVSALEDLETLSGLSRQLETYPAISCQMSILMSLVSDE